MTVDWKADRALVIFGPCVGWTVLGFTLAVSLATGLVFGLTAAYPIVRRDLAATPGGVYRPRRPQASPLYRLIEDHFEEFSPARNHRSHRGYGCRSVV